MPTLLSSVLPSLPPGAQGATGGLFPWTVKTANYTANSNDQIIANTFSGAFTITLPASPVLGSYVRITDGYNWSINNLTIGRNGATIEGVADDVTLDIGGSVSAEFIHDGTTWQVTATTGATGNQGVQGPQGAAGPLGGSNTQIAFNDNGNANGSANLTFLKTTNSLQLTGNGRFTSNTVFANTYSEFASNPSISAGVLTLDLRSSNYFYVTLNENIATITINNTEASGNVSAFALEFIADGTARTVTWPGSFDWPDATAPTLSSINGKRDLFFFITRDGGTNWYSFTSGQNL